MQLHPVLIQIGWLKIHTYGFLLAMAFLTGLWAIARAGKREGIHPNLIYDLGLYLALSALAGAKLLLFFTDLPYYLDNPREIFSLSSFRAGGVFYGGFLAAVAVAIWFSRKHQISFMKLSDLFAPGIALGLAIGRLGCFSSGCCYGHPTNVPWAVTFTNPYSQQIVGVPLNIPLHPVQLYESTTSFLIFLLLWQHLKKRKFTGQTFVLFLSLYSVARFILEFFRGDEDRGIWLNGMLSTSQIISLGLFLLAGILFWKMRPTVTPGSPQ
jgi:phosphatidylglycerol:prolipoprotein diacylglycerol transferase